MIKDPAFWRVDGHADGRAPRARAQPAAPARRARRLAPRDPRGVRRPERQRREPRGLPGARARRPEPADQVRRAVGPVRLGRLPARHQEAPRQVAAGHHRPRDPRRVRDDRDRARIGCRGHRHDGDLRPRDRGVRHPHAVPRRVEGLPRQRGAARQGGDGLRAAHHGRRQLRRALLLRAAARRRAATSSPASAARTTASRAASTASTTAGCTSTTCACRARTCSTATATSPPTARTRATSPAPAAASSRCSARSCRAACRSTAPRPPAPALALYIALTYANQRRQFDSGAGSDEVVLLDYGKHQRRLLPLLAQNYAQFFAHDELLRKFDGVFSGRTDTPEEREDLETLAAALKPLSTWNALDTIQEAREACGGAGFLAENRLVGLHQDLDVYVTFEGDNNVLLQLVGKRLLSDYAKQFKGKDAAALARFAVAPDRGQAVPRRRPAPARPVRRRLRLDRALGRAGPARRPAARAARRPRAADGRRRRGGACARHPSSRPPRRPRCSTRTSPSSSRRPARTPSCCSGRRSPTPSTASPTRAPSRC